MVEAGEVGLQIHPHGYIQTLPALGAYVGADIVAGVLATGVVREDRLRVFVDVGTNGEIVLGSAQRALATAAPAGPAFEGSQIKCGMRATVGAIEGVQLSDRIELQVIGGDVPPEGICGSGLVDVVAQLLLAGLMDHSGRLKLRTRSSPSAYTPGRGRRSRCCPTVSARWRSSCRRVSNTWSFRDGRISTTRSSRCSGSRFSKESGEHDRARHLRRPGARGERHRRPARLGRRHLWGVGAVASLSVPHRR